MTELTATTARSRINSIDILRGVVMVIMALDHVRDFFHNQAFTDDPMNLATTTPWLYFTRWITHFCAPTFVFLAGTSAFLMGLRRSKAALSRFLITRGLWLIFIELFVITLGWTFNPYYNVFILQVIWAIGMSMIILGLLVRFPYAVILSIGLIIFLGHNLLDDVEFKKNGNPALWWDLLHHARFGFHQLWTNHFALVVYSVLPWTGVMILGYCFGKLFSPDVPASVRKKRLVLIGLGLIALFIILRLINEYGNPQPWSTHPRGSLYSFLSFLDTSKYPASLMFLCMTLGPAILMLAFLEQVKSKISKFFMVFGRVPFFYYVLHFYLIHLLCVIAFFASGYTTAQIRTPQFPFLFRPPTFGFDLWVVYAVWIAVVLALYPLCKMYDRYKTKNIQQKKWLSYL
jgi:uncharacterized membrane protein